MFLLDQIYSESSTAASLLPDLPSEDSFSALWFGFPSHQFFETSLAKSTSDLITTSNNNFLALNLAEFMFSKSKGL